MNSHFLNSLINLIEEQKQITNFYNLQIYLQYMKENFTMKAFLKMLENQYQMNLRWNNAKKTNT